MRKSNADGAAQYKCDTCSQTFNSKAELQEHQRMMHPVGNEHFRCDMCGEEFKTATALSEHKRIMHPEKERARP